MGGGRDKRKKKHPTPAGWGEQKTQAKVGEGWLPRGSQGGVEGSGGAVAERAVPALPPTSSHLTA